MNETKPSHLNVLIHVEYTIKLFIAFNIHSTLLILR